MPGKETSNALPLSLFPYMVDRSSGRAFNEITVSSQNKLSSIIESESNQPISEFVVSRPWGDMTVIKKIGFIIQRVLYS